ncbi:MAG: permease prefix domain 1-containing protein [Erysipelotrichaceae bacterium]
MEKITMYVNNMFAILPNNKEVRKLKENILENMKEQYEELINEGKSEDEAFALVISKFGNIEEIKEELGINNIDESKTIFANKHNTPEYKMFKQKFNKAMITGIGLIFLSIITVIALDAIPAIAHVAPSVFFLLVGSGVCVLTYYGMENVQYNGSEAGALYLNQEFLDFKHLFNKGISKALAIIFIGLSITNLVCDLDQFKLINVPMDIVKMFNDTLAGVILMGFIGVAVMIMVYYGIQYSSFIKEYEEANPNEKAVTKSSSESLMAIVMPIAAMIYLLIGFTLNLWHPGWVIFPICACLVQAYSYFKNN